MNKLAVKKKVKKKDHPSLDIVNSYGTELSGKDCLCIAGSVAAYKAIGARLLMRHGQMLCVASNAVTKLIQPDYFKWATGNKVITKLKGKLNILISSYNQSDL